MTCTLNRGAKTYNDLRHFLHHVAAAAFRYPALKPQTPSDRKVGGGYHLTKSDTVLSCHDLVIQQAFALRLTYRVRSSDCGGSTAVLNQTVRGVSG